MGSQERPVSGFPCPSLSLHSLARSKRRTLPSGSVEKVCCGERGKPRAIRLLCIATLSKRTHTNECIWFTDDRCRRRICSRQRRRGEPASDVVAAPEKCSGVLVFCRAFFPWPDCVFLYPHCLGSCAQFFQCPRYPDS